MSGTNQSKQWQLWLLALPAVLVIAFFLSGLGYLFSQSFWHFEKAKRMAVPAFELGNYKRFLFDPFYYQFLWRTLRIGALVTLFCLLMGYPVAYLISRTRNLHAKRMFLALVVITALIGVVNRSYAWLILLGVEGPINDLLRVMHLDYRTVMTFWHHLRGIPIEEEFQLAWPFLFNEFGVVVGLIHRLLPFMIIFLNIAIENIDPALEDASRSLGAGKVRTFLDVTLPLSLKGAVAGSLFVFGLTCSDFVMPDLLGGSRIHTMSNKIQDFAIKVMNYPFGSAMAFIMLFTILLIAIGLYLLLRLIQRRTQPQGAHNE